MGVSNEKRCKSYNEVRAKKKVILITFLFTPFNISNADPKGSTYLMLLGNCHFVTD